MNSGRSISKTRAKRAALFPYYAAVIFYCLQAGVNCLAAPENTSRISITTDKRVAQPGERVVAVHSKSDDLTKSAWIGFYRGRGSDHKDYISYTFLSNLTDCKYDVTIPNESGSYHFRVFIDGEYDWAGTSDDIIVGIDDRILPDNTERATAPSSTDAGRSSHKIDQRTSTDRPVLEKPSIVETAESRTDIKTTSEKGAEAILDLPAVLISVDTLPKYEPIIVPEMDFPAENPEDEKTWTQTGVVWQKSPTTITIDHPDDILAVEIAPILSIGTMADSVYAGAVSAAMEGMRIIYGPFDEAANVRFNKLWAPLFHHPCDQVIIYLNQLTPLLGRYISLRAAVTQAAAHIQEVMVETAVTATLDNPSAVKEPLQTLDALLDSFNTIQNAMTMVVKKIDELGDPPNPLECRAKARKKHSEARKVLKAKSGTGAWALQKEWVETTWTMNDERIQSNTVDFKTNTAQICSTIPKKHISTEDGWPDYIVKWDYEWTEFPIAIPGGINLKLNCMIKDAGTTYEDLSSPDIRIELFSTNHVCDIILWDGKLDKWEENRNINGIYRSLVSETPGVGGVKKYTPQRKRQQNDITAPAAPLKWTFDGVSKDNLAYHPVLLNGKDDWSVTFEVKLSSAYIKASKFYLYTYNSTNTVPKMEEPDPDVEEDKKRKAEAEALARKEAEAAAEDLKATIAEREENIKSLQKTMEAYAKEFKETSEKMQKDKDFAARNPELLEQLSHLIIQASSNIRHEKDIIESLVGGQLVHTRTAWDEISRQEFLRKCQENANNSDLVLRIRNGIERQLNLLPEDQQQAHREWASKNMKGNITDSDKAKQVAGILNEKLQGYWEKESATHLEKAIDAEQNEFYAQMIKTSSIMLLSGMSATASAEYFGELATITTLMPTIVGIGFGGLTGTIEGGPIEGLKHSLWASGAWGAAAANFISGAQEGYRKRGDWKDALKEGEKAIVWGYCMGKAFQFGVGIVAKSTAAVLGKRATQPLFGTQKKPHGFTAKDAIAAAKYEQEIKDARSLINFYHEKKFLLEQKKTAIAHQVSQGRLPDLDLVEQVGQLEKEVFGLAASINSSYYTKIMVKHHSSKHVSAAFRDDMNKLYEKMLDRTNSKGIYTVLSEMGYQTDNITLAAKRNGRSGGTASMDLDLALDETPGLKIIKNGKQVSVETLQEDGQKALLKAYKNTTKVPGQRSDLHFTTSKHSESYPDQKLLETLIEWDKVDPTKIPAIGKVTGVKIESIQKDPIMNPFAKQKEQSRQAAKDIEFRVLEYLKERAKSASTPGEKQEIQEAIEHWTKLGEKLKIIGEKTLDPIMVWEQMQQIRTQTGGGGIAEIPHQIERDLAHFTGSQP